MTGKLIRLIRPKRILNIVSFVEQSKQASCTICATWARTQASFNCAIHVSEMSNMNNICYWYVQYVQYMCIICNCTNTHEHPICATDMQYVQYMLLICAICAIQVQYLQLIWAQTHEHPISATDMCNTCAIFATAKTHEQNNKFSTWPAKGLAWHNSHLSDQMIILISKQLDYDII